MIVAKTGEMESSTIVAFAGFDSRVSEEADAGLPVLEGLFDSGSTVAVTAEEVSSIAAAIEHAADVILFAFETVTCTLV